MRHIHNRSWLWSQPLFHFVKKEAKGHENAPFQYVTKTLILHLKEGIDLGNMAPGTGASYGPVVEAIAQLINTLKAQYRFIRQFWCDWSPAISMNKLKYMGSSSRRPKNHCSVYR